MYYMYELHIGYVMIHLIYVMSFMCKYCLDDQIKTYSLNQEKLFPAFSWAIKQ